MLHRAAYAARTLARHTAQQATPIRCCVAVRVNHAPAAMVAEHACLWRSVSTTAWVQGEQQQQQRRVSAGGAKARAEAARARAEAARARTEAANATIAKVAAADFFTSSRFADSPHIDALSKRALAEVLKYETMTPVQEQTLPVIAKGSDVLAKAKTGTGKTLGFLIPTVDLLAKQPSSAASGIGAIILVPTRELAIQTLREAELLTKFHKLGVQKVIGGTNIETEKRLLARKQCDILVATPGRLLDHLENANLGARLKSLKVLCFDECDRMLDMGFQPTIKKLLRLLPPTSRRQNLLFSATVPPTVAAVASETLQSDAVYVDTVGNDTEQTHKHVQQESLMSSWENVMPTLFRVLRHHVSLGPHKIIVFFPTANFTQYAAAVANAMGLKVGEIHSRKSQSARTRASDTFLKSQRAILFSSDVSARGMDYPGITLVVQVGLTDQETYVHRLGRTARAGQGGKGLLLLAPDERSLLQQLRKVDISPAKATSFVTGGQGVVGNPLTDAYGVEDLPGFNRALATVAHAGTAKKGYIAWLGFYNSNLKRLRWSKDDLVRTANTLFASLGLPEPPAVAAKTLGKMGVRKTPGIREEGKSGGFGSGGRSSGGGGGGGGGGARGARGGAARPVSHALVGGGGSSSSSSSGGGGGSRRQVGGGGRGGGTGGGANSGHGYLNEPEQLSDPEQLAHHRRSLLRDELLAGLRQR